MLIITPLLGVMGIISNKSSSKQIALLSSVITLLLGIIEWITLDDTMIMQGDGHLGIDGLSIILILLTTIIIPICIIVSWDQHKHSSMLILLLILESALIAIFCVTDLLLFYICFEVTLIPMFILIGVWGSRSQKIYAAYQFFIYTLAGSLLMLLSIILLYMETGSTSMEVLSRMELSESRERLIWLGFFISFAIKVPLIPFHVWLPYAHTESPLAGSILLAGVLLKLAGYGFIRVSLQLLGSASMYYMPLIYTLCIISIIYASLTTLRQIDLKSIIAYSSIGHMGIVVLGIFSNTVQGISGSILLMITHGLVSPGLFICVTALYDRYHTRIIKYYRGLVYNMPLLSTLFFLLILANIGIPLTGSFLGEILILMGSFEMNGILTCIGALGMILAAAYSIWLYNRITFGIQSTYLSNEMSDLNKRELSILSILLLLTIILGIYPNVVLDSINLVVSSIILDISK